MILFIFIMENQMRKVKRWFYLLALLSIPLSNVQADAEKTTTSLIENILGNPDVCQASYGENGVLNVPCVDVSLGEHHTAYRAKLEVNDNLTKFKLISSEEITNLSTDTSNCISKYDVNSGKLEIPCLNKDVLFLLADISENPLYFFNATHEPRNVREGTRSSLVENTTKCNTPYANAANFYWKKFQDPIYDARIAKLSDLFNGVLESEQQAVSLIIDTINASVSIKGALDLNSSELDSETNKKILSSILGTSGMVVAKNADNNLWATLSAEALDGASLIADPKSLPIYFTTKLTGIVKDYYYIWTAWTADKKLKQLSAERSAIETLLYECTAMSDEGRNNAVSVITDRKITKWDDLIATNNCPEEYRNSGNAFYQCLIYNGLFGKDGSWFFGSDIDIPVAADKVQTIVLKVHEQAMIAGYKNPLPKTWYGNGSIIAYGSRNKTTERSFGLVKDMSKYTEEIKDSKPGVFFFQWQKENKSGKNLKIEVDGSEKFLVSITYGLWNYPENHVTYKNVTLPFVLDPCKDFQSACSEGKFFTIAVSLVDKKAAATIRASATNDDSTFYNEKPTKHLPVIVDGHVWTGTGSIINYSAGDIQGDGLTQDQLEFVWGDGWESPAVFFQWQVKKGKQKLEITTSNSNTTIDEMCLRTLNITYGPWNTRKYNSDARVTNGKYTITISDADYESGGQTWIVIKVVPEIPSTCYDKGNGVTHALIKAKAITSTN